jgi:hypothetical protein
MGGSFREKRAATAISVSWVFQLQHRRRRVTHLKMQKETGNRGLMSHLDREAEFNKELDEKEAVEIAPKHLLVSPAGCSCGIPRAWSFASPLKQTLTVKITCGESCRSSRLTRRRSRITCSSPLFSFLIPVARPMQIENTHSVQRKQ